MTCLLNDAVTETALDFIPPSFYTKVVSRKFVFPLVHYVRITDR